MVGNTNFNESWKNSILVKNAKGNYEFRFRKKSAIEAKRKKMMIDFVDRDGDGKVTFEEIMMGEEIPKEEEEKLRLKFERLDVDKDGFVNAEDALRAFEQDSIICKVCNKEFDPEMGTKEFDYEICGETEDCKNKLWKLEKT
jgi:Ca2+-binding EF-hand superfamily protein